MLLINGAELFHLVKSNVSYLAKELHVFTEAKAHYRIQKLHDQSNESLKHTQVYFLFNSNTNFILQFAFVSRELTYHCDVFGVVKSPLKDSVEI